MWHEYSWLQKCEGYLLGVTAIADMSGPYTPLSGIAVVPFPAQYRWISKVPSSTSTSDSKVVGKPNPLAATAMSKFFLKTFPYIKKIFFFAWISTYYNPIYKAEKEEKLSNQTECMNMCQYEINSPVLI